MLIPHSTPEVNRTIFTPGNGTRLTKPDTRENPTLAATNASRVQCRDLKLTRFGGVFTAYAAAAVWWSLS